MNTQNLFLRIQSNALASFALDCIYGSLILALFSYLYIPLWFSPVPITGQTLGVLLIAIQMGSTRALSSVLLYLLEGSFGAPFFAAGSFGFYHLLGPTGGYLVGFSLLAYFTGKYVEIRKAPSFLKDSIAFSLISFLHLAVGSLWLSNYVGIQSTFAIGFSPFILGALIKAISAATYSALNTKLHI